MKKGWSTGRPSSAVETGRIEKGKEKEGTWWSGFLVRKYQIIIRYSTNSKDTHKKSVEIYREVNCKVDFFLSSFMPREYIIIHQFKKKKLYLTKKDIEQSYQTTAFQGPIQTSTTGKR